MEKRDNSKVSPFISMPTCPGCKQVRNVKAMAKKDFFYCSCGAIFCDPGYAKRVHDLYICPECGLPTEDDNWQLYSGEHYVPFKEKVRRNFHKSCWIKYYHRIDLEYGVATQESTYNEIVSQLTCPKCRKREIYAYPDDNPARKDYLGNIYQCMSCDYIYPSEDIDKLINEVRRTRADGREKTYASLP